LFDEEVVFAFGVVFIGVDGVGGDGGGFDDDCDDDDDCPI